MMAPPHAPDTLRLTKASIFLVAATLVLVGAAYAGVASLRFVRASQTTPGTVTRLVAGPSHPEIRFRTRSGEDVVYLQGGLVYGHSVGQGVQVRYDPAAPQRRASVDTPLAIWGMPVLLTVIACGLAALGLAGFRSS